MRKISYVFFVLISFNFSASSQGIDDTIPSSSIFELSIEELMSIEVTINRIKEKAFEASGTVYVITEQDIKIKGYKDLKDVLVELPGVGFAGYTGDVDMTRVRVRGITENMKILVVKDGIKLNNPSGTPLTWGNNLPLHDIEQIEIVIGPASVMYGQNTYSALVNMKTKRTNHVNAESAGGNYQTLVPAFSFHQPLAKGKLFFSGRAFFSEGYDRYKDYPEMYKKPVDAWKDKIQDWPSKFTERDLMTNAFVRDYNFQLEYTIKKLSIGAMVSDLNEVNSLPHNPELYLVNHRSPIRVLQYQGYLKYNTDIGRNWRSQSSVVYVEEIRGFEYGFTYVDDPAAYDPGAKKYFSSFDNDLRVEEQLTYSPNKNLTVNLGGIFENINAVPQIANFHTKINPRDSLHALGYEFQNYGAYAQASWKATQWFKLVGGMRVDYNSIYEQTFNPRIALIFFTNSRSTLKAMHGQAYLAPSMKDLYFVNPAPNSIQISNPNLRPQKIYTEELSFEYRITKDVSLTTNVFFNTENDIITLALINTDSTGFETRQNQNINQIQTYGGELAVRANVFKDFRIAASYAYLDGVTNLLNDKTGEKIRSSLIQVCEHKWNISLTYMPTKKFAAHLNAHYMGRMETNKLNAIYKGGYLPAVFNLDLNVCVFKIWERLDVQFQIRNLLNSKQYHLEARGYGIRIPHVPQPLLNYNLTLRYYVD